MVNENTWPLTVALTLLIIDIKYYPSVFIILYSFIISVENMKTIDVHHNTLVLITGIISIATEYAKFINSYLLHVPAQLTHTQLLYLTV